VHHKPASGEGIWEESAEDNILRCDAGEREKITSVK
jgi:hypothetical protein